MSAATKTLFFGTIALLAVILDGPIFLVFVTGYLTVLFSIANAVADEMDRRRAEMVATIMKAMQAQQEKVDEYN